MRGEACGQGGLVRVQDPAKLVSRARAAGRSLARRWPVPPGSVMLSRTSRSVAGGLHRRIAVLTRPMIHRAERKRCGEDDRCRSAHGRGMFLEGTGLSTSAQLEIGSFASPTQCTRRTSDGVASLPRPSALVGSCSTHPAGSPTAIRADGAPHPNPASRPRWRRRHVWRAGRLSEFPPGCGT